MRVRLNMLHHDKMTNKSKRFTPNHRVSGQWSGNIEPWGRSLSPFMGPLLRINLAQVVMRIEDEHNFRWPPKIRTYLKNTSKLCAFHKDIGHETRDCRHLKNKIDDLLFRGSRGKL